MRFSIASKNSPKRTHLIKVLMLGALAYLTDNANLTSASSFDVNEARMPTKTRLPAEISKPVLTVDCSKAQDTIEMSTPNETVRLEALNCRDSIAMANTKMNHKLVSFQVGQNKYSSEFAYLARGENFFTISSGTKTIKIAIYRF